MSGCGIIVGCDQNQEWLLAWWWENYSEHNSYPVTFADFGMSAKAKEWCQARGAVLDVPLRSIPVSSSISASTKQLWENHCGKGIWFCRSAWFQKPFALLASPYTWGVWLDLDCQVKGALDPLFYSLAIGADIGLVREPLEWQISEQRKGFLLPGEVSYNAGVIAFRKEADILHHWAGESIENNLLHLGDQNALNRAIFLNKPSLIELPTQYNWFRKPDLEKEALIHHFIGGEGKLQLLQEILARYKTVENIS